MKKLHEGMSIREIVFESLKSTYWVIEHHIRNRKARIDGYNLPHSSLCEDDIEFHKEKIKDMEEDLKIISNVMEEYKEKK